MKTLAFAASTRRGSLNQKLIEAATAIARANGAEVDLVPFADFDMPLYDGDLQAELGLPPGALALRNHVEQASAILIAAPEYNYSISGVLKNAIDWVSRARPMPWRGKSIYLLSASPSPMGGIRGLWQTRIPLEGCGALVFPDMFALPHADQAFADDGTLANPANAVRLQRELLGFLRLAEAVAPICGSGSAAATDKQREQAITAALERQSAIQPPSR